MYPVTGDACHASNRGIHLSYIKMHTRLIYAFTPMRHWTFMFGLTQFSRYQLSASRIDMWLYSYMWASNYAGRMPRAGQRFESPFFFVREPDGWKFETVKN